MPFAESFDAVYEAVAQAAEHAIPGETVRCHWLKDLHAPGQITDDIVRSLREAELCIADVSGNNPNVMWETGYAMALSKPTILIGQDVEALPFDLMVHRVLPYGSSNLAELGALLKKSLVQTMARYDIRTVEQVATAPSGPGGRYVVTGTTMADPALVRRRAESLLAPYLGDEVLWYCGSNGNTDEVVVQYLVSRQRRVICVGYNRYDCSAPIRQLVDKGQVMLLDATLETIPRGMTGPTARDVFFATRADLIVLFWDGVSQGTAQLADYFRQNQISLLLGFVPAPGQI
jgi:hypothetical protein